MFIDCAPPVQRFAHGTRGAGPKPVRHTGRPCAKICDASGQCTVYEHERIPVVKQSGQRICIHMAKSNDYGGKKTTFIMSNCIREMKSKDFGGIKSKNLAYRTRPDCVSGGKDLLFLATIFSQNENPYAIFRNQKQFLASKTIGTVISVAK